MDSKRYLSLVTINISVGLFQLANSLAVDFNNPWDNLSQVLRGLAIFLFLVHLAAFFLNAENRPNRIILSIGICLSVLVIALLHRPLYIVKVGISHNVPEDNIANIKEELKGTWVKVQRLNQDMDSREDAEKAMKGRELHMVIWPELRSGNLWITVREDFKPNRWESKHEGEIIDFPLEIYLDKESIEREELTALLTGLKYYQYGQYEEASAKFEQTKTRNHMALYLQALALFKKDASGQAAAGQYAAARKAFGKLARFNPDTGNKSHRAYLGMGHYYLALISSLRGESAAQVNAHFDNAEEYLEDPLLLGNRAYYNCMAGDFQSALSCTQRLKEAAIKRQKPGYLVFYDLLTAIICCEGGRPSEAERFFHAAEENYDAYLSNHPFFVKLAGELSRKGCIGQMLN